MFVRPRTPSLGGATDWLNSESLGPAELHGRVVLIDFWTATCINWLRTQPYIRAWSAAYRSAGLLVIGVHTPEFSFEHDGDLVRAATLERGIDYPVAIDNDYAIWDAFNNHYWPALYFMDRDGTVRDHHFGEGRYERSERILQEMLGVDRQLVSVEGRGVEAAADWQHLRTPETYLGSGRSDNFASVDGAHERRGIYELPSDLPINHWALGGEWKVTPEKAALTRAGGTLACRFHARDAHLVLSRTNRSPISFRVLVDGEAPGPSRRVDVDDTGQGVLRDGRLYQLVREQGTIRDRTVSIIFSEPGRGGLCADFRIGRGDRSSAHARFLSEATVSTGCDQCVRPDQVAARTPCGSSGLMTGYLPGAARSTCHQSGTPRRIREALAMSVTELEAEHVPAAARQALPYSAAEPQSPAWIDVVVLHEPLVRRHALRLTGNQHDADDLTQDVFLRALSTPATSWSGTTAGWLYRITTNLFIDSCRRRMRRPEDSLARHCAEFIGSGPSPADVLEARCLSGDVQAALDDLPTGLRSAVILRDIEALSYAEISECLGLRLGTVRSHIHRGRRHLRKALAGRDPGLVLLDGDLTRSTTES